MKPSHYVGIGASAGGLEAIEAFFANVPQQTGLAFVVVQHLSPRHKSLMVELLSKRTVLPVRRAESGLEVEADTVFMIPPNRLLKIFHGRLVLSELDPTAGLNLPIDVFLRSLAEDQGERTAAVILSGTGGDGSRGLRAVKEAGGLVVVQDAHSARFDGMPHAAIATGLADLVLPPSDMPAQLLAALQRPAVVRGRDSDAPPTSEDGLTRILALVRQETGIDFTHYKTNTVMRRIQRRVGLNQLQDIDEYVRCLETQPTEVDTLCRELLIGVTSFFRDRQAFTYLADQVLPDLVRARAGGELRIWVAGCSTGEEAYTLAMLVRECQRQLGCSLDLKVFATDVARRAIAYAAAGTYPDSLVADIDPELLQRYFLRREDGFQVARQLREAVVFAHHNVLKDPPFSNIDLISCRNLLIYVEPAMQSRVLDFFSFALNPAGVLFLGNSESLGDRAEKFETLHGSYRIFRSRGRTRLPPDSLVEPRSSRSALGYDAVPRGVAAANSLLERLVEALVPPYFDLAVIINERREVRRIVGDSSGLLRLPPGPLQSDLARLVVPELETAIATGTGQAFSQQAEVRLSRVPAQRDGERRQVEMRFLPLASRREDEALVAVLFRADQPETEGTPEIYRPDQATEQYIRDLEAELQLSRENLQATIEELETANEELQATNEELLASNEELQSTNEELQSVNEELHTVNAEYQRKIVELTAANNDIDNLLNTSRVGAILLDENLEVRRYTRAATGVFRLMSNDIGRSIGHLQHSVESVDPMEVIRRVQATGRAEEHEVNTPQGKTFLLAVEPYQIAPEAYAGLIVSLTDISLARTAQYSLSLRESELTLARTAQRQSESLRSLLLQRAPAGMALGQLVTTDRGDDVRILEANAPFEVLAQAPPGSLAGQLLGAALPALAQELESHWLALRTIEGGRRPLHRVHLATLGDEHDVTLYLTADNGVVITAKETSLCGRCLLPSLRESTLRELAELAAHATGELVEATLAAAATLSDSTAAVVIGMRDGVPELRASVGPLQVGASDLEKLWRWLRGARESLRAGNTTELGFEVSGGRPMLGIPIWEGDIPTAGLVLFDPGQQSFPRERLRLATASEWGPSPHHGDAHG